jgi:RNA polymerase-binding transcription factor DksA
MITTNQLFAEDFKLEWMTHKQRIRNELRQQEHQQKEQRKLFRALSFDRATTTVIEQKYRAEATASRLRIVSRCDKRGNYTYML